MINVGDLGEDYEHGLQILKKLSEFRSSSLGVRAMEVIFFHRNTANAACSKLLYMFNDESQCF